MEKRKYYFIRHALPLNDAASFHLSVFDKDMLGKVDESLSDEGKQQAALLKNVIIQLNIQRIISSTRKRAMETAGIIARETGLSFEQHFNLLDEINLGSPYVNKKSLIRFVMSKFLTVVRTSSIPRFIRKKIDYTLSSSLMIHYFLQWSRGNTSGGELLADINGKIKKMLNLLDDFEEERLAVVCHAGWILFLTVYILGGSKWNFLKLSHVDNCSLTRIDSDGNGNYELKFFAIDPKQFIM